MQAFYYSLGLFGVMEFLGDIWPGLIANRDCYPYLGCNAGFFGYDAVVHFLSGLCIGLGILWASKRGYLRGGVERNLRGGLFFLGWELCVAVGWECVEWSYDHYRMWVLHMDLLHPLNVMAQPSFADTLGDITFGVLGAMLIYFLYVYFPPKPHQ